MEKEIKVTTGGEPEGEKDQTVIRGKMVHRICYESEKDTRLRESKQ